MIGARCPLDGRFRTPDGARARIEAIFGETPAWVAAISSDEEERAALRALPARTPRPAVRGAGGSGS